MVKARHTTGMCSFWWTGLDRYGLDAVFSLFKTADQSRPSQHAGYPTRSTRALPPPPVKVWVSVYGREMRAWSVSIPNKTCESGKSRKLGGSVRENLLICGGMGREKTLVILQELLWTLVQTVYWLIRPLPPRCTSYSNKAAEIYSGGNLFTSFSCLSFSSSPMTPGK